MVFRVLNRLIGRTDQSDIGVDTVNAYVDGNASNDEIKIVEEMMRENPALEKDLSTQQALRSVLGRIEKVEAPRSFAITPEMVAAAEGSESGLSRLAELFAPQRKLALAPAIIAGIAALSVALLTIGDISGVVEQSEARRYETNSAAAIAESSDDSGAMGAPGQPGNPGAAGAPGEPASSDDGSAMATVVVAAKGDTVVTKMDSPAATAAPAMAAGGSAPEPEMIVEAEAPEAPSSDPEDRAFGSFTAEPPSLAAEAPLEGTADEFVDTAEQAVQDEDAIDEIELAKSIDRSDSIGGADAGSDAGSAGGATTLEEQPGLAYGQETSPQLQSPTSDDGISLPLWQLQVALAALALAAIGAWAGLRRARGE